MTNYNPITKLISTFFYIGKIRYAPGTFGSLAAFPLAYFIAYILFKYQLIWRIEGLLPHEQILSSLMLLEFVICVFLFFVGLWCSDLYSAALEQNDPKEIVIDEVVGQMLVIILCAPSIIFAKYLKIVSVMGVEIFDFMTLFALPFVLFRFFDIIKPWPISWIDKNVKGGLGIMLDDVIAALFASVTHYILLFLVI